MSAESPLGHYQAVNAYGAVAGDRVQLILKMMNAAVDRIVTAKGYVRRREIAAKGQTISGAIGIIEGLRAALNRDQGGAIAQNLDGLYDYMTRRLVQANLKDDERLLDEVAELLNELRSGWEAISREPAAIGPGAGTAGG